MGIPDGLVVHTFIMEGLSSHWLGKKILQASQHGQNKRKLKNKAIVFLKPTKVTQFFPSVLKTSSLTNYSFYELNQMYIHKLSTKAITSFKSIEPTLY